MDHTLTREEYTDLIDHIQDMVDDEVDNPDVQEWNPILAKLKGLRETLGGTAVNDLPPLRDHNGECFSCDEPLGHHAPECAAMLNLQARLRTEAICIQPQFCAATRRQAANEIELSLARP